MGDTGKLSKEKREEKRRMEASKLCKRRKDDSEGENESVKKK